jgi:enoyl-CoA hydratase/carnithine racemase
MTDYQFCRVEREGPLTIVTFERSEVMNALHPPAHYELSHIFDIFAADPHQCVCIVTGSGNRAFSAGNDLKYQASGGKMSMPPTGFAGLTSRFDLNKPLIAAVNGFALGGGFEIALACDIIVASETAVFALPEPRVGLAAVAGGLYRLPREIGTKRALGMILTGRRVSAKEGEALGFVNEVVTPTVLMVAARAWAEQILAVSPMAVRASKEAVYRALGEVTLADAVRNQIHYPELQAMYGGPDYVEGMHAFVEKRTPRWNDG